MNSFVSLNSNLQSAMGIVFAGLLLGGVLLLISCLQNKRWLASLPLLPVLVLSYMGLQCICGICKSGTTALPSITESFANTSALLIMVVAVILIIIEILIFNYNKKWQKTHISRRSVQRAIDNLPVGICCYEKSGRVVLKNKNIESLCRDITGESLLNGNEFSLCLGEYIRTVGENELVFLPDKRVFALHKRIIREYDNLTTLTFEDITHRYRKTKQLMEKQQLVSELNRELTEYGKMIASVITEKEILSAKIKLHDELGTSLLSAKNYILNGSTDNELSGIVSMLGRNIELIKQQTQSTVTDEYQRLFDTAKMLGVEIRITGDLPESTVQKHITVTAIHECLTNTLRYAHGKDMTVKADSSDDTVTLTITNGGEQPTAPIKEKGGLASLRTLTENSGGNMVITTENGFCLTINIPKKEEINHNV